VRSLARTAPIPKSERAREGRESEKEAAEGSKPEARATLERIEKGIAYVKVIDHDARLAVINQYDCLLARIRAEHPHEKVDKISAYVGRPKLHAISNDAGGAS